MKKAVIALVGVVAAGLLAQPPKHPVAGFPVAHHRIAQDLTPASPDELVQVIVQYQHQATEHHHQAIRDRGGSLRARLDSIKAAAYSIPASRLREIAEGPDVVYISPDRAVGATMDVAAAAVNATVAYSNGYTGSGIGVAVIDGGIMDSHPDIQDASGKSRVVYAESFNLSGGNDYYDRFGHGTHVAGVLGGDASASTGSMYTRTFRGIAPKIQFVNLKVLDLNGAGTDSMVISAIQRAIALKSTYNIRVINLSLGRAVFESYTLDPLCQAVEAAWKAGIVVVAAAGNMGRGVSGAPNGYGTITAPGNDPYVITVGAMKTMGTASRSDDLIASYSSKGPTAVDHIVKPDIVAPGNRIVSTIPAGLALTNSYPGNKVMNSYYIAGGFTQGSDYYFQLSGTSMAAPMVSGAAALLLQSSPNLTPDQVKARLMHTASKSFPTTSVATDPVTGAIYTSQYDIFSVGAGYLDISAALASTTVFTGSAQSPVATRNPQTKVTSVVCPSNSICGSQSLWDSKTMWGNQSLWDSQTVWDSKFFLSATQSLWDSQTLWDTQSIWATQSIWDTTTTTGSETTTISINGEK